MMTTGRPARWSRQANGTLMARTPPSMIRIGAFWLVEPRRFELLTSCLQIMPGQAHIGADLGIQCPPVTVITP